MKSWNESLWPPSHVVEEDTVNGILYGVVAWMVGLHTIPGTLNAD